jgi:hypothetical protein
MAQERVAGLRDDAEVERAAATAPVRPGLVTDTPAISCQAELPGTPLPMVARLVPNQRTITVLGVRRDCHRLVDEGARDGAPRRRVG